MGLVSKSNLEIYWDVLIILNQIQLSTCYITILIFLSGAFVPLTEDGNIVVGGVLASCYASFNHDLAHFSMISIQWYPDMMGWIFGMNNGSPEYVNIAKEFGRWVLPSALLFQKSG